MFCFLRAVYESFLNIRRTVCCVPFTYRLSWVNWVESGQVKAVKAHIVQSLSLCYVLSIFLTGSVKLSVDSSVNIVLQLSLSL